MIKKRNNIIRLLLLIFTHIQTTCPVDTASPASGDPIWQIAACALENNTCIKSSLDTLDTQGALSILDEISNTLITLESNLDALESEIDAHPRIITGHVNISGTILAGSGFSIISGSSGQATITFDTPFASAPFVIASIERDTSRGSPSSVSNVANTGFQLNTYDSSSGPPALFPPHPNTDRRVFFVAMGT